MRLDRFSRVDLSCIRNFNTTILILSSWVCLLFISISLFDHDWAIAEKIHYRRKKWGKSPTARRALKIFMNIFFNTRNTSTRWKIAINVTEKWPPTGKARPWMQSSRNKHTLPREHSEYCHFLTCLILYKHCWRKQKLKKTYYIINNPLLTLAFDDIDASRTADLTTEQTKDNWSKVKQSKE